MEAVLNPEAQNQEVQERIEPSKVNVPVDVREQIDAKIAELKEKHKLKKVFVIIVEGEDGCDEKPFYIGYFKRPNFIQFSQYMSFVQKDLVQANQSLAQNLFVDGDKELVDNPDMFLFGTMTQINQIIESRNAEILKK